MILQESIDAHCPSCGEPIQLLVDCSVEKQEYIEDCQVYCRPMQIFTCIDSEGVPSLSIRNENE